MPDPSQTEPRPDTRARLLEAAGETFAELGYRNATVREVCKRAEANIAAVKYHFGDKAGLYLAVLTYTAEKSLERNPIGGDEVPGATAADRLESFIRSYVERMLDEGRPAWFGKLVAREMVEPTEALEKVAKTFARPMFDRLRGIISELLGPGADEITVQRCSFSVIGQCLFYKHARPMIERLWPEQRFDAAARDELARHVTRFSLAALQGLKEQMARA